MKGLGPCRPWLCTLVLFVASCTTHQPDYTTFLRRMPRSILVLPPLNSTATLEATNKLLPAITKPLAEQGYYVYPIAIVDAMLKENGVASPVEAREVSRLKLREIFGADAVLDITIENWSTQYLLLASPTRVTLSYRLVDLASGDLLWSTTKSAVDTGRGSGAGLTSQLLGAALHAASSALSDKETSLARQVMIDAVSNGQDGLLKGPRYPKDQ